MKFNPSTLSKVQQIYLVSDFHQYDFHKVECFTLLLEWLVFLLFPIFSVSLGKPENPKITGNNDYAKYSKVNMRCVVGIAKMLNVCKDFNMAWKVNRLAMTLSYQTVACFSHCACVFIKFTVNSYSTTVRHFITFRAKTYYAQDFFYIKGQNVLHLGPLLH